VDHLGDPDAVLVGDDDPRRPPPPRAGGCWSGAIPAEVSWLVVPPDGHDP